MAIDQQRLTLGDFLRLPDEKPTLEFEDGEVCQKVSPKGQHSTLQWAVRDLFNRFARERRLAMAFPELRATVAGRSDVPDVSVSCRDQIPRTDEGEVADDFFEPPALAIEIVSPEHSVNRLVRRCLWYVDHRVVAALLIDPRNRSVLLCRPDARPVPLRGDECIDLDDGLLGFTLAPAAMFVTLTLG